MALVNPVRCLSPRKPMRHTDDDSKQHGVEDAEKRTEIFLSPVDFLSPVRVPLSHLHKARGPLLCRGHLSPRYSVTKMAQRRRPHMRSVFRPDQSVRRAQFPLAVPAGSSNGYVSLLLDDGLALERKARKALKQVKCCDAPSVQVLKVEGGVETGGGTRGVRSTSHLASSQLNCTVVRGPEHGAGSIPPLNEPLSASSFTDCRPTSCPPTARSAHTLHHRHEIDSECRAFDAAIETMDSLTSSEHARFSPFLG
ncbi:hypothetical protein BDP67DRAFT_225426 [Colletotrichum lupini]|nr:hypothetical protein BDP67DRAFT_225426 [Colletotrichum lupini]